MCICMCACARACMCARACILCEPLPTAMMMAAQPNWYLSMEVRYVICGIDDDIESL